jgi:NIPSNAP
MKHIFFIVGLLLVTSIMASAKPEYYALITYRITNQTQETAVDAYLRQAYLPALHRLGKKNIGVFKPVATDTASFGKVIFILVPFSSLADYEKISSKLEQDTQLEKDGSAYINARHNEKPYERIEITLMRAFTGMTAMEAPKLAGPRPERVYELRSYEAATEKLYRSKVKMFNAGDEIGLFKRLGFNAVFYAEVIAGSRMPNLVYMTTFDNKASRDEHWKAFVADAHWKHLLTLEEYKNTISKMDIWLLTPTEYSDY